MLTADFKHGNVIGKVRRRHPSVSAFDAALYEQKLMTYYDVGAIDLTGANLRIVPAMTIIGDIQAFAKVAADVIELNEAGYDWPHPRARAEQIDVAFRHYLENKEDGQLWFAVKTLQEQLSNPNGEMGPESALTPEQRADPLS